MPCLIRQIQKPVSKSFAMMTSLNGNIYRVTGHLGGEFTGPGDFPAQRPVTRSFDVSLISAWMKWLSKQSRGWWFGTQSDTLWRHCNVKQWNQPGGRFIGFKLADGDDKVSVKTSDNLFYQNNDILIKFVWMKLINFDILIATRSRFCICFSDWILCLSTTPWFQDPDFKIQTWFWSNQTGPNALLSVKKNSGKCNRCGRLAMWHSPT